MRRIGTFIFLLFVLCSCGAADQRLTYIDLVDRLTDLERLAVLPEAGESCEQWSSYDRASEYSAEQDRYINWGANSDGDGFIRKEGDEIVMAEMEGPGVIWRIWSALARDGNVKIYLDGEDTPVSDLPFDGYFNRNNEPFTQPALVYTAAKGRNAYIPIPYRKSCKITAEKGWGRYFHFTYSDLPEGTALPTFSRDLEPAEFIALDKANELLSRCGFDPAGRRPGQTSVHKKVNVSGGETAKLLKLNGEGAITAIKVRMDLPGGEEDYEILRELALSIYWDGEDEPSVWCPLGDFFGTAPGVNHYKSLPLGMTEDGFYCYWYMPFARGAVVKLSNDGKQNREVEFEITHAPLSLPVERLGRFHAKWHRDAFLPEEPERRWDWTMIRTIGRGRFVGVMLHIWDPRYGWWGEGDEKFFVDGEKFPSTFGTGSEDYFGYAWCMAEYFSRCYHNQTKHMHNMGHISVNRWHIADNVPFQESFEGAIEKYFLNNKPTLYAAVAYWYLSADGKDLYKEVPLKERVGYWVEPEIKRVKGAIEGELMSVVSCSNGRTTVIDMTKFGSGWSCNAQRMWVNGQPGDVLELAVPVEATGKYRLKLQLTKAFDFGIVQLYWDGEKLGEPVDVYDAEVVPADMLDYGVRKMEKGKHVLKVKIVGTNEKAKPKGYRFAIDYLLLEKVG